VGRGARYRWGGVFAFTTDCHYQYCMMYGINREGREGGHILRKSSRNSLAVVWVMRMGGGFKGVIDSCTHKTSKRISCIGQEAWGHLILKGDAGGEGR